jgi:MFS family permease
LNRNLVLLSIALASWGVGEGMFFFFQPLYLQELGANPVQIGAILGVVGIAMSAVHIPAGYLSNRFGRHPLLISAWMLGTTSIWVMALANTLPEFVVGSVLYGLTAFVAGPLNGYTTAVRGNMSVGRVLTLVSAFYNMGAILGPLLGGWIAGMMGLRGSFYFAGGITILSTLLITQIRAQPVEKGNSKEKTLPAQRLLTPRFALFLGIIGLAVFAMYLPQPLTVNFLQNEKHVSIEWIGVLIAARSFGVVLLNLTLGRKNARYAYLVTQLVVALFVLLIWKGIGIPFYVAGYLLLGAYQTSRSLAAAQGRALVEDHEMNIAYGMIETVSAVAVILAPPLAGVLYAESPTLVYIASLGGLVVSLFVSSVWMPLKATEVI